MAMALGLNYIFMGVTVAGVEVRGLELTTDNPNSFPRECRGIDWLTLSAQVIPLIPVVPAMASKCVPIDSPSGYVYLFLIIALKVLAWALVSLFVAGYTNIIRRPNS
jgi:hypothetical protein